MRKGVILGIISLAVIMLFFGCLSTGESTGYTSESQDVAKVSQEDSLEYSQETNSKVSSSKVSNQKTLYKGAGLTVAILPPELRDGEAWMQQSFQDNITSLMARHSEMTVLDRKNEDLIIAQQQLSDSLLYSEEGAVEIGQLTNAQYVVVGSIQKLSNSYECNFRVNETATNEIRSASTSRHSLADMESGVAVRQIVQELFGGFGIQLTEAEQAALQKKNDVESTSITMLAKGAQAQASEDYIQAVLYYNQVGGTFQQEASASTNKMFSVSQENLTVRQRQQYNQIQQEKWQKILDDLRTYLNENLWIGVYHDPLVVKETNISMSTISYEIPSVMKIFPNREVVIVAKKVMEEWYKVKNNPDNKVWTSGLYSSIGQWRYEMDVGLFDADGNQLGEPDLCWTDGGLHRFDRLFSSSDNPANYVVRSQKKYFEDAKDIESHTGSDMRKGAEFRNIKIQDMSENTVLPTARILKIEGTNDPTYGSEKRTCKLTLYTMSEWEALMAQQ